MDRVHPMGKKCAVVSRVAKLLKSPPLALLRFYVNLDES